MPRTLCTSPKWSNACSHVSSGTTPERRLHTSPVATFAVITGRTQTGPPVAPTCGRLACCPGSSTPTPTRPTHAWLRSARRAHGLVHACRRLTPPLQELSPWHRPEPGFPPAVNSPICRLLFAAPLSRWHGVATAEVGEAAPSAVAGPRLLLQRPHHSLPRAFPRLREQAEDLLHGAHPQRRGDPLHH